MSRRGVSLIELMIALTITMIMMGAVVTLFANMTNSVTDSRAVIEMSERIRIARNTLQNDLAWHTAPTLPPLDPAMDQGYFEIIEGPNTDSGMTSAGAPAGTVVNPLTNTTITTYSSVAANNVMGDCDDVLMLTVRSQGAPFVGRGYSGSGFAMMESNTAEIIWYALPNGRSIPTQGGQPIQLYTLYRRVLLVLPTTNITGAGVNLSSIGSAQSFYAALDLSARYDTVVAAAGSGTPTIANTLGDLTKRENRFYHGTVGGNFPFPVIVANLANAVFVGTTTPPRAGEDVILTDVLAFDVQVFDPVTPIRTHGGVALSPSEPGWASGTVVGSGAFVNLGYSPGGLAAAHSRFSGQNSGQTPVLTLATSAAATWDTWSLHYEQNGYDEDGALGIDQGTNGLDDNADGIIDTPPSVAYGIPGDFGTVTGGAAKYGERETLPPYIGPLRAVQVKIRVYEPDSRQVRQVTVVQDFLPE